MFLGFALTEHCNLRCPHCIRDDVTTVRNLPADLLFRTVDDALGLFPQLTVSMPGQFNRNGNGYYTVAVYNVPGFDPAMMDEAKITLGGTRGPAGGNVDIKGADYRAELKDLDGDGDLDLELKFRRPDVAPSVASGSDVLTLRGNVGCRRVAASQSVRVNH